MAALEFFVNGVLIKEENPDPHGFLVGYLRRKVGLTGAKEACLEGGCGSCTVLLSKFDVKTQKFRHASVNACITPICSLHACHILTIEGLGGKSKECHFLQDAIAQGNGTQCGFCSPGMVMAMHGAMCSTENAKIDVGVIKGALQGNLCRCTGYRPILESFINACETPIEELPRCTPCLEGKRTIHREAKTNIPDIEKLLKAFHASFLQNPPCFKFGVANSWLQPNSFEQLVDALSAYPDFKLIGGSTELDKGRPSYLTQETDVLIHTGLVPEMRVALLQENCVKLGASLTISEMISELKIVVEKLQEWQARSLCTILNVVEKFGSAQIRNAATIGGSIVTVNPASDIQTVFAAFKCRVECFNRGSKGKFGFTTMLSLQDLPKKLTGIVVAVEIPLTEKSQFTWAHKAMRRSVSDAAIINFAALITTKRSNEIQAISLAMGGRTIKRFNLDIIPTSNQALHVDDKFLEYFKRSVLQKLSTIEGDSIYSCTLAQNLCVKYYNWLRDTMSTGEPSILDGITGTNIFKSSQIFDKMSEHQPSNDLVGKPLPHASAYKHATGEARFVDDIPKMKNELALAFVLSKRPHARINNIDFSKCQELEGFVKYLDAKDILSPEKNCFGLVVKDEEIFASEKVNCVGQIIGAVLAKSRAIAKKAADLVYVEYEDIEPCILTMDDAITHNSFYHGFGTVVENGNCKQEFLGCTTLSGRFDVGSQSHFYMEPQGCLAIPNGEDGEMEVISSTQNPMDTQLHVANLLDVPANRITVKVKRVGGGFGGKESRSLMIALPCALAASKMGVPVRCILDRQTDTLISGNRNPFRVNYSVTFDSNGRISALEIDMYCNAGHSLDVSNASMERAVINVDNAYNIPNFKASGYVCKTNMASNTVFRGTGAPQAALIIENILDHVASSLGKEASIVRKLNLYSEGNVTPYGQTLHNSTIRRCWEECIQTSEYIERLSRVEKFNRDNNWKKRGISVNPVHMGIAYTALFLNQASALVHIYRDGSVLLSHGGVEIGQGLHSKMTQVATRELGVSADKIRIVETSTDKVPNATPTSASSSSDMNGMAVIDACQKIIKRLEPFNSTDPSLTWEELVAKAYMDRTSLSATGFYKIPGIGWNEETKKGNPFNYFSTGAACTEVELDCLTGQHVILRTDIVMDVGQSLNPAIDLGQIEGAFMQGVGLYTIEDLKFGQLGEVETLGPNSYKIPTAGDIPLELNVSFLSGANNPRAVYSSKTVGEPPLLLATSVFFAIKDAIRRNMTSSPIFELNSPATVERILMALEGQTNRSK